MTLRGRVGDGVIKLLEGPIPAEGTEVSVRVERTAVPLPPGANVGDLRRAGIGWVGAAEERTRLLDEVRAEKQRELENDLRADRAGES
jgi:hypothetical protein